jgi:hypothetical protein
MLTPPPMQVLEQLRQGLQTSMTWQGLVQMREGLPMARQALQTSMTGQQSPPHPPTTHL